MIVLDKIHSLWNAFESDILKLVHVIPVPNYTFYVCLIAIVKS